MLNSKKAINTMAVIMGLLGYVALCLPWYELTASSYISGVGSSSMFGGMQFGFTAAGTSFFGYALYILPGAAIALAVKGDAFIPRAKALLLELIGVVEFICLFLVNMNMGSAGTSISGSGYSSSAGFGQLFGYTFAMIIYIATVVVGLILMLIAPKVDPDQANSTAPTVEAPAEEAPEAEAAEQSAETEKAAEAQSE